ncbi:RNA-processing protein [Candidatus Woesearchaeota archaeon]|nr:RNA-processing protein [Candidatus Woesearchaeota archaeon]
MQEEYSYELKIPKERVAVLIGTDGKIKKQIEEETKTNIKVDSREGEVYVSGSDALSLLAAREIIRAIGRGFNPEVAQLLVKPDYGFEIIALPDYAKTQNDMVRLKGRVIGREGKSRKIIEELTQTDICVYGKTIGIIGQAERVGMARQAVITLLEGGTHASVYKWLEKQQREMKKAELLGSSDRL